MKKSAYKKVRVFSLKPHCVLKIGWLVITAVLVQSCTDQPQSKTRPSPSPVPVRVATAVQKSVPREIRAIGNVQASSVVTVKPQVTGRLAEVHFEEGDNVKAGTLLFKIDSRPFQARLRQAQATLAHDQAQLRDARRNAERYAQLIKEEFVAQAEYEQARTKAAALAATVAADQAVVEQARIELQHTSVRAPISGRTGNLLVNAGNVVKADETPLVTIYQLEPVYVSFSVPEEELWEVRRRKAASKLIVRAVSSDQSRTAFGQLSFIDNKVDPETGTVQHKATFPNNERTLWPGEFVDVVMTLAIDSDAIVLPAEAVHRGKDGWFVFVVDENRTARHRSVTVDREVGQLAVIKKGIAVAEVVVTEGHLRLFPGAPVEIRAAEKRLAPSGEDT
ncbi:MAG TPA: efflux RND transporter periplasmic adaptor subunit [Candidatus Udaeobacter sp.]|nr:efflux RND transporter periplasmic adaptor subunit [Candidatus Udaeobacter sp.]